MPAKDFRFVIFLSALIAAGTLYAGDGINDLSSASGSVSQPPAAGEPQQVGSPEKTLYIPKHKKVDLRSLYSTDRLEDASISGPNKGMMGAGAEDYFIDPPRDQGDIGSCHAFTAVAVLEAAYARYYGKKIRLSEADLFLRRNIIPTDSLGFQQIFDNRALTLLAEGGSSMGDTAFGLEEGISRGDRRDYREARRRYAEIRNGNADFLGPYKPDITAVLRPEDPYRTEMRKDAVQQELIKHFGLDAPERVRSREEVRNAFRGFRMKGERYTWNGISEFISPTYDPAACRKKAAEIPAMIAEELDQGRAVGVCMIWPPAAHCLAFIGYSKIGGELTFLTRNSQGFDSSGFFRESDLCRVTNIFTVLNPNEK